MQDSWESMDVSTANILNRTTQAFYAAQAESFSATRQSAWAGWQRVLADTGWEGESEGHVATVFGNKAMRPGEGVVVGDGLASGDGADGADGVVRAGALDAAGVTDDGTDADAEETRRHPAGVLDDGTGTSAFRTSEFGVRSSTVDAAGDGAGAGLQREGALRCGEPEDADASAPLVHRILDVACGNVRFKSFLEGALPNATWDYRAVDACEQLVGAPAGVAFMPCDIVATLIEGRALPFAPSGSEGAGTAPASGEPTGVAFVPAGSAGDAREDAPREDAVRKSAGSEGANADLTVCFGFFHHVPGCAARERLLRALCAATVPGGLVAVSLWRFMDEPGLAKKAHESHEAALRHFAEQGLCLNLDANDYLLGWQQAQGVFRYCHHFADEEVMALAASVSNVAQLADCFHADGRTGDLNEYLVFRVR